MGRKMSRILICAASLIFLSLSLLLSCTSKPSSELSLKEKSDPAALAPPKMSGEDVWANVVTNAKKEGLIVLYGATGISQAREPFVKAIKERFGITLDVTVAGGPQ